MNTVSLLLATSPARDPLTVTVKDALSMIGIGRTKFYAMVASGQITTITIGHRRLVHMASLRLLVGEVPAAPAMKRVKPRQLLMEVD